jgi:F-type H+-transporting ATPase subunit epsilon
MTTMIVNVVTPDSTLFKGDAHFVSVPAAEGEAGFLAQAAPLMSTLNRGLVRVKTDENDAEPKTFAVDGGYVEADGHKVVVLASRAIDVKSVDAAVSRERIAAAQQKLQALSEGDSSAAFYKEEIAWQTLLERVASS